MAYRYAVASSPALPPELPAIPPAKQSAAPPPPRPYFLVIPGVDVTLGTVTFVVNDRLERHWFHEPRLIARALSQAVRPARWFPETQVLTLTVAATGHRAGLEKHFSFAPTLRGLLF
ncbi:hypothetical protein V3C33_02855 [Micrococcaceae bacterium Sec5.7]